MAYALKYVAIYRALLTYVAIYRAFLTHVAIYRALLTYLAICKALLTCVATDWGVSIRTCCLCFGRICVDVLPKLHAETAAISCCFSSAQYTRHTQKQVLLKQLRVADRHGGLVMFQRISAGNNKLTQQAQNKSLQSAVCCSVLQCVAVCCSVLQYVVVKGSRGG